MECPSLLGMLRDRSPVLGPQSACAAFAILSRYECVYKEVLTHQNGGSKDSAVEV